MLTKDLFIMRQVPGRDLAHYPMKDSHSIVHSFNLTWDIVKGLHRTYGQLHGDFHENNILVESDPSGIHMKHMQAIDFGRSKPLMHEDFLWLSDRIHDLNITGDIKDRSMELIDAYDFIHMLEWFEWHVKLALRPLTYVNCTHNRGNEHILCDLSLRLQAIRDDFSFLMNLKKEAEQSNITLPSFLTI